MQLARVSTLPSRLTHRGREVFPGLLLCAAIAIVATVIGRFVPVLGSAIPAVVIGVVIALWRTPATRLTPGITYSGKFVLQLAVALLGSQLSFTAIAKVGRESLPVMLVSLAVCLTAAAIIGRLLKLDRDIRTLIGVGTGICGASAIAATAPVIKARDSDISYAISTVFLFNILAVLLFPMIGHGLGMDAQAFGLFAGTAINDTSSVVAAASVFSASALGYAVVVKLVRTLMIIPITVTLAVQEARRTGGSEPWSVRRIIRLIPWFLIGFILVTALTSIGVFPVPAVQVLTHTSVFLVTTALAGIGLSTNLRAIRATGIKPLLLGGILSVIMAATTLTVMQLAGHL